MAHESLILCSKSIVNQKLISDLTNRMINERFSRIHLNSVVIKADSSNRNSIVSDHGGSFVSESCRTMFMKQKLLCLINGLPLLSGKGI